MPALLLIFSYLSPTFPGFLYSFVEFWQAIGGNKTANHYNKDMMSQITTISISYSNLFSLFDPKCNSFSFN